MTGVAIVILLAKRHIVIAEAVIKNSALFRYIRNLSFSIDLLLKGFQDATSGF